MSYTMIKNCKMNWETEEHSYTFVTGGDRLTALDSLGDLIRSLRILYDEIVETTDSYDDEIPNSYKVTGGCTHANIKGQQSMTEELEQELRMLGVLDHKTPAVEIDAEPIWIRDDVVFDEDGQPNFQY